MWRTKCFWVKSLSQCDWGYCSRHSPLCLARPLLIFISLPLTLTDAAWGWRSVSFSSSQPAPLAAPLLCPDDMRVGLVFLSHPSFTAVRQRLRHCVCCSWVWEARGHRSVQTLINTLMICNRERENEGNTMVGSWKHIHSGEQRK